jgi:NifU-like protein involved in Fe-S cluster formation
MVGVRLREVLVAGELAGECSGPDVSNGAAEHPVCGDQVQLSLRRSGDVIVEARWRAAGCPASVAVAALAARVLAGVPVAEAAAVLRAAIVAHGGLAAHEGHAEAMALRALAAAIGRP